MPRAITPSRQDRRQSRPVRVAGQIKQWVVEHGLKEGEWEIEEKKLGTAPCTIAAVAKGIEGPAMVPDGTPVDCVRFADLGLLGQKPDLIVSGINLGFNHGTGFMMSSGTVGAAVEGWVSGIPALAFSTGANGVDWNEWRRHALSPAAAPDRSRRSTAPRSP